PILQRAGQWTRVAFHNGPIRLLDAAFAELLCQARGGLTRAREQEDTRHRLIEPLDDAQKDVAGFFVFVLEILLDRAIDGFLFAVKVGAWRTGRLGDGD